MSGDWAPASSRASGVVDEYKYGNDDDDEKTERDQEESENPGNISGRIIVSTDWMVPGLKFLQLQSLFNFENSLVHFLF